MKSWAYIVLMALGLAACDFSSFGPKKMDAIDSLQIVRYDRVEARYLTTGDFSALQEMNMLYPTQTRALIENLLQLGTVEDLNINRRLLEFFQDSTLQSVIYAAESEYADMSDVEQRLKTAFRNLRKVYPKAEIPTVYTQIGALAQSIVVDNQAIGVSLDKYLGEDFPVYERYYDDWQRMSMTRDFIAVDVLVFYILSNYAVRDFDNESQHDRDMFMAVVMHAVNTFLEERLLVSDYITRVEQYLKDNPRVTIKQMIERADYLDLD